MSFSIVTVTLNAAEDLALTIESIIQQDFDDFELIIVDGGSTDRLNDVLERYRDSITKFVRVEDAGVFYAMNESLCHCSKEYVIFMNAKDRFYSRSVLSKIKSRIQGAPDVVYGDHIYLDKGREIFHKSDNFSRIYSKLENGEVDSTWLSRVPCHQATFTRTSLLKKRRYDTRYELCADHNFMFEAYAAGGAFQYIDETVCHYMGGGLSAQRSDRLNLEQAYLYRQFTVEPKNVDGIFFANTNSPFSIQTRKTGIILTGLRDEEGPYPELGIPSKIRWCYGPVFKAITPSDGPTSVCILEGYNIFPEQKITLQFGNQVIAVTDIPVGFFTRELNFSSVLGPKTLLDFHADQCRPASEVDTKAISVAVAKLIFLPIDVRQVSVSAGETYLFDSGHVNSTEKFFAKGWSRQEQTHRWSVGNRSSIMIKTDSDASEVIFTISPNPFAAVQGRVLRMEVNGRHLSSFELTNDRQKISISCLDDLWHRNRLNVVVFENDFAVEPPGDPRLLGVCLYMMTIV